MDLKLMGAFQVKTVEVKVVDRKTVVVSGRPFGIKMFTDGLMVVGASDIPTSAGRINPAKEAGIQAGDILLSVNNVRLTANERLGEMVDQSGGTPIEIRARRGNSFFTATVYPALSQGDGKYRIGVWVRDSSAGIGVMTYYDPGSGLFTGLGHAVCDVDTGELMPLSNGEIVRAQIVGCKKGLAGAPGELKGKFLPGGAMGTLLANTSSGVYGAAGAHVEPYAQGVQMPLAMSHEVKTGEAAIYTTLEGETPKEYRVEIEKVMLGDAAGQNMVIRVTDPELLEKTGGIVQGMSGSPIVQNGMLAGSVTQVFVNDPSRGFGIFAENIQNNAYHAQNLMGSAA
jgi:stage IV sporulation protein B